LTGKKEGGTVEQRKKKRRVFFVKQETLIRGEEEGINERAAAGLFPR